MPVFLKRANAASNGVLWARCIPPVQLVAVIELAIFIEFVYTNIVKVCIFDMPFGEVSG